MKVIMMSLAAAGLVAATSHGSASVERKCADTPVLFAGATEPAYVLDGSAVDRAAIETLDHDRVESIFVVCAPVLYDRYDVKAQRSGLVVFTKPGPVAQLRASLDGLEELQRDHFAIHGTFSDDLEQLGWSDSTALISVELRVPGDGRSWSATGSHRFLPGPGWTMTVSGPIAEERRRID